MSDNLAHSASLNYSGHFPFRSPRKSSRRPSRQCSPHRVETIRSSSLRGTNINNPQYSIPYLSCQSMGGFEPDLNGFLNQIQSTATAGMVAKYSEAYPVDSPKAGKPKLNGSEGGIEPDLNYFFPSQCDHIPWNLECKLNRAGLPVNQAKILFQYKNLPPLNPTTNKKIDQQKIPIGFGGGARRAVGAVGVELESNCSRTAVNQAKIRLPQTLRSITLRIEVEF